MYIHYVRHALQAAIISSRLYSMCIQNPVRSLHIHSYRVITDYLDYPAVSISSAVKESMQTSIGGCLTLCISK